MAIIVLLQKDLRLKDNPALFYAAEQELPIIPVYLNESNLGSANIWWREKSFCALEKSLSKYGLPLLYYDGNVVDLILRLRSSVKIDGIYWNYLDQDTTELKNYAICKEFYQNLLFSPLEVNREFKLCAPFWKHCLQNRRIKDPLNYPNFRNLHKLKTDFGAEFKLPLLQGHRWWSEMEEFWKVGEEGAQGRWLFFKENLLRRYGNDRNIPALEHTSMLSPHLRFGEISVRQLWNDLGYEEESTSKSSFVNELGWREFSYNLSYHNKNLRKAPLNEKFAKFPWKEEQPFLRLWQKGQTGYPIIDAAMRQLWQIGWMHNRTRMVVASFLSKNLLIPWQHGEEWFFDTLVDADAAINGTNWQWVAGCGTDSAPYFRIFNPTLQAKKFDPKGDYVRRWVPELQALDSSLIHEPFLAGLLKHKSYPEPIIDLSSSRRIALDAFDQIKRAK